MLESYDLIKRWIYEAREEKKENAGRKNKRKVEADDDLDEDRVSKKRVVDLSLIA